MVAEAVAREGLVGVGGVGTPGLDLGAKEVFQLGATDGEQRTQDFARTGGAGHQNNRMDAAQPLGPGSAQQLHQDGFGLVIQSVRGQDGVGVSLSDQGGEAVVAESPRGLLNCLGLAGLAAAGDAVGHAGMVDVQRDLEAQAERLHEG